MTIPRPFRALTLELSQARLDRIRPEEIVGFVAEQGFTVLVCFALGYLRGEAYYPSKVAPPHPELGGRDLLDEVCQAGHRHGVTVYGYVNSLFGGSEFYGTHPDWLQRKLDGSTVDQGEAKAFCPNSPYRDIIKQVIRELGSSYPIRGLYLDEPSFQSWCACGWCGERYRKEVGEPLPDEPRAGDQAFARFLEWRSDVVADFVADCRSALQEANDSLSFFAQHAFPLSSTAHEHLKELFWGQLSSRMPSYYVGWYRPSFYGQDITKVTRHLDLVGLEPWITFTGQPRWWVGATVSYARHVARGRPVVPLMEYPHFPWGVVRLSDDVLEVAVVDVVANGGEPWFPLYAPHEIDRGGLRVLGRTFQELDRIRDRLVEPVAEVGVVASRRTAERFGMGSVEDRYLDELVGTVQIVRELHVPYRLLSAEVLEDEDLRGLSAVVLPQGACLSEREARVLERYVEAGGLLICTGWSATHDDTGARRNGSLLEELLGVRFGEDEVFTGIGYLLVKDERLGRRGSRIPIRDGHPSVETVGADVIARSLPSFDLFEAPAEGETYPAVTLHGVGDGQTIYVAPATGRLRWRWDVHESTELWRRPLRMGGLLLPEPDPVPREAGVHTWLTKGPKVTPALTFGSAVRGVGAMPSLMELERALGVAQETRTKSIIEQRVSRWLVRLDAVDSFALVVP